MVTAFKNAGSVPFGSVAIDQLDESSQTPLKADIVAKCGGLPDILGGYFGTLLPCVIVNGEVLVSESGHSLHLWLQQGIAPPFEMVDDKGIVGCSGLDELVQKLLARVEEKLAVAA